MNTMKKLSLTLLIASSLLGVNSVHAMVEESKAFNDLIKPYNDLIQADKNAKIDNAEAFLPEQSFKDAVAAIKKAFVENFQGILNQEDIESKLVNALTKEENKNIRLAWGTNYKAVKAAYKFVIDARDASVTKVADLNDRAEALYAFCEHSKATGINKISYLLVLELLAVNQALANEHIKNMLCDQTAANQMLATLINIENVQMLFIKSVNGDAIGLKHMVNNVVTMVTDKAGCVVEYNPDFDAYFEPTKEHAATIVQIDEHIKLIKGENVDEAKIVHKQPMVPGIVHTKINHTAITHKKVIDDTMRGYLNGSVVDYMSFEQKQIWVEDALICLKDKIDKTEIEKEIKALKPYVHGIYAIELAIIEHSVNRAA